MPHAPYRRTGKPYIVNRTPRGSVVVCTEHLVTDEITNDEALALANALNAEHLKRHS
jgi:hypothetical protein